MPTCVFCEIVAGRAESSKLFEDDRIVAFLTIRPTRPGEFTVIQKDHIDHFCDVPDELAGHVMVQAQRLSRIARERLNPRPKRMGLVVHGFGVPHAHLIAVPLHHSDDIVSQAHAYLEDGKIRFGVQNLREWTRAELDEMAAVLAPR